MSAPLVIVQAKTLQNTSHSVADFFGVTWRGEATAPLILSHAHRAGPRVWLSASAKLKALGAGCPTPQDGKREGRQVDPLGVPGPSCSAQEQPHELDQEKPLSSASPEAHLNFGSVQGKTSWAPRLRNRTPGMWMTRESCWTLCQSLTKCKRGVPLPGRDSRQSWRQHPPGGGWCFLALYPDLPS